MGLMELVCNSFGHKWNCCRCVRCGKVRDANHVYEHVPNSCIARCSVCGKEIEEHKYTHRRCPRCGKMAPDLESALKRKDFPSSEVYRLVNDLLPDDLLLLAKGSPAPEVRLVATYRLFRQDKAASADMIRNYLYPNGEADKVEIPDETVLERLKKDPGDLSWLTEFDLLTVLHAVFIWHEKELAQILVDLYRQGMYQKELKLFKDKYIGQEEVRKAFDNPAWGPDSLCGNPYAEETIWKTVPEYWIYKLDHIQKQDKPPVILGLA